MVKSQSSSSNSERLGKGSPLGEWQPGRPDRVELAGLLAALGESVESIERPRRTRLLLELVEP